MREMQPPSLFSDNKSPNGKQQTNKGPLLSLLEMLLLGTSGQTSFDFPLISTHFSLTTEVHSLYCNALLYCLTPGRIVAAEEVTNRDLK